MGRKRINPDGPQRFVSCLVTEETYLALLDDMIETGDNMSTTMRGWLAREAEIRSSARQDRNGGTK